MTIGHQVKQNIQTTNRKYCGMQCHLTDITSISELPISLHLALLLYSVSVPRRIVCLPSGIVFMRSDCDTLCHIYVFNLDINLIKRYSGDNVAFTVESSSLFYFHSWMLDK